MPAVKTALILCGALAWEVKAIVARRGWDVDMFGIAGYFHSTPNKIAPAVEERILELRDRYERLIVVYGDCGTVGELDAVLKKYDVERLPGHHCFEWYGGEGFHKMMDEEPGTFFLTDFMVRAFRGMIIKSLGLDRFPELREEYFRHYKRIVYMVQKPDPRLIEHAKAAANYLQLPLEIRATGYNDLEERLAICMQEVISA